MFNKLTGRYTWPFISLITFTWYSRSFMQFCCCLNKPVTYLTPCYLDELPVQSIHHTPVSCDHFIVMSSPQMGLAFRILDFYHILVCIPFKFSIRIVYWCDSSVAAGCPCGFWHRWSVCFIYISQLAFYVESRALYFHIPYTIVCNHKRTRSRLQK